MQRSAVGSVGRTGRCVGLPRVVRSGRVAVGLSIDTAVPARAPSTSVQGRHDAAGSSPLHRPAAGLAGHAGGSLGPKAAIVIAAATETSGARRLRKQGLAKVLRSAQSGHAAQPLRSALVMLLCRNKVLSAVRPCAAPPPWPAPPDCTRRSRETQTAGGRSKVRSKVWKRLSPCKHTGEPDLCSETVHLSCFEKAANLQALLRVLPASLFKHLSQGFAKLSGLSASASATATVTVPVAFTFTTGTFDVGGLRMRGRALGRRGCMRPTQPGVGTWALTAQGHRRLLTVCCRAKFQTGVVEDKGS